MRPRPRPRRATAKNQARWQAGGDPALRRPNATEVPRTAVLAGERAAEETEQRALRDPAEPVTVRELFEAGVHFGHQTKRWNPKMRPYIYGARSGIHIIDLDQTVQLFKRAFDFVSETVAAAARAVRRHQAAGAGHRARGGARAPACTSSPTVGSAAR